MTNGTFHRVWRDFEAWRAAVQDDACPDCLRLLLQGRIDYLAKPDPTHWKAVTYASCCWSWPSPA